MILPRYVPLDVKAAIVRPVSPMSSATILRASSNEADRRSIRLCSMDGRHLPRAAVERRVTIRFQVRDLAADRRFGSRQHLCGTSRLLIWRERGAIQLNTLRRGHFHGFGERLIALQFEHKIGGA